MHEPKLYLTVPKCGIVEAEGRRLHLRPAPMTLPAPQGVEAPLAMCEKPIGPPQGLARRAQWCSAKAMIRLPAFPIVKGKIVLFTA